MAYFSATQAAVVDTDMPAVTDVFVTVQNTHFLFQTPRFLYWAAHLSASALRSKLNAADLRTVTNPYIRSVNATLLPGSNPNWADYSSNPLKLSALEEIAALVTDSAAAHHAYILAQTDPSPTIQQMPAGNIYTLRGTSTTAAVVGAWTQQVVTWQDTLPGGNFVCVGLTAFSANMVACRLVFPGQVERPGVLGGATPIQQDMFAGKKGMQGVLGRFASTFLPIPEVLCDVADVSQEFYLDIVRVP